MKLANLVKEIEECGINCSLQVFKGCVWMDSGKELTINTDGSVEDLRNEDGQTYGFEYSHYEHSEDNFFVYHDADNGHGHKDTIILLGDEQVTLEDEE